MLWLHISGGVDASHHRQILNGTKQHQQQQMQIQQHQQAQQLQASMGRKEADMLDVPGKGRCFVYIVRY